MNSNINWDLEIDPAVFKEFKKIPRKDAERILSVIRNLPSNPFEFNGGEKILAIRRLYLRSTARLRQAKSIALAYWHHVV